MSARLDQWSQLVGQYGQSLIQLMPEQLRTDLLAIIPDELENELDHPLNAHATTYEQIMEWCKSRKTKSRKQVIAAQQLKQVGAATSRMAPLTSEARGDIVPVEEPPTWAAPVIATLKPGGLPRGRSPGGRSVN